jgi:UDP-N-acetylmuramate: L-alanyl-gamma-D-glutamyl-meso-diaminopimelate ligase
MKILILGACGTFMAGIAQIAHQQGHELVALDEHAYPPMSTLLAEQGIVLQEGFEAVYSMAKPDLVIIGNVLSRGHAAIEHVLKHNWPYISAPQWLYENVLYQRKVLAVAGTHGKTTTTSMLAWVFQYNHCPFGFLIGGLAPQLAGSAALGEGEYFIIEADEYDSAFFDKRPKFIHYRPQVLVLNNLEYDHADIYPSLEAIERQCHFLLRTVPPQGTVLLNHDDKALKRVLKQGAWSDVHYFSQSEGQFTAKPIHDDYSCFDVFVHGKPQGRVDYALLGRHNMYNALAAIAVATTSGIPVARAIEALCCFEGVKRRLEIVQKTSHFTLYDDFAHHPTAIEETVKALRARIGTERLVVLLDMGSATMKLGHHNESLPKALLDADATFILLPSIQHADCLQAIFRQQWSGEHGSYQLCTTLDRLIDSVAAKACKGDHLLVMSNRGLDGLWQDLPDALKEQTLSTQSTGS